MIHPSPFYDFVMFFLYCFYATLLRHRLPAVLNCLPLFFLIIQQIFHAL